MDRSLEYARFPEYAHEEFRLHADADMVLELMLIEVKLSKPSLPVKNPRDSDSPHRQ